MESSAAGWFERESVGTGEKAGGAAGGGVRGCGALWAWSIAVRPSRQKEIHDGRRERGVGTDWGVRAVSFFLKFDLIRMNHP